MIKPNTPIKRLVHDFVFTCFNGVHKKRLHTIFAVILGIIDSKSLSISNIGRSIAKLSETNDANGIKLADRFLGNEKVETDLLMKRWAGHVMSGYDDLLINIDWTEFDTDHHSTLSASLQTYNSRSIPLLWRTINKDNKKGNMNNVEDDILNDILEVISDLSPKSVIIVADRGFMDSKLMKYIKEELGYDFVIRIKSNIFVTDKDGETRYSRDWAPKDGTQKIIKDGYITSARFPVNTILCSEDRRNSDNSAFGYFCLASSLDSLIFDIDDIYGGRFSCEETFRDIKDIRTGFGMSFFRTKNEGRRDKLLLLGSISLYLIEKIGETAEEIGLDKNTTQSNNRKRRRFSLRTVGFRIYAVLNSFSGNQLSRLFKRLRLHVFAAHDLCSKYA